MLGQGRHLHWSDQAVVGKALSLNCYNDSTILHKAKYVVKIFMYVYDTLCVCIVCVYLSVFYVVLVCVVSMYLSVCLPACLSVCLPACLSVHLSLRALITICMNQTQLTLHEAQ